MELLIFLSGTLIGIVLGWFILKSKNEKINNELITNLKIEQEKNKLIADNKEEAEKSLERLNTQFENIANKIIDEKSQKFTKQNQENLEQLLKPFGENINDFKKRVNEVYDKEGKERFSLKQEVNRLVELNNQIHQDANNLTNALRGDNKTQGDWGEMQLEMILERSGLEKEIHYTIQGTYKGEDGRNLKPDFIVNLPDKKNLIIDSKVSLTSYNKYFSEQDENLKKDYLKEHINSIRKHIDELSKKNYQNIHGINQPDYVFMFLPVESAFWLALKQDANLIEKALEKNIVLVSTTNLLATLRIISMIWKQEKQKNNVLEIAKDGGALYDKFVGFLGDMEKVGRSIKNAKDSYSDAMNKLYEGKGNIIRKVENLKKLGSKTSKNIDTRYLDKLD